MPDTALMIPIDRTTGVIAIACGQYIMWPTMPNFFIGFLFIFVGWFFLFAFVLLIAELLANPSSEFVLDLKGGFKGEIQSPPSQ